MTLKAVLRDEEPRLIAMWGLRVVGWNRGWRPWLTLSLGCQ
jgi:hypothetical protein